MLDPDYEIFVAIVAAGSLSGAGRTLGLSPASVSKRLARLEHRLGLRLLHRTTREIRLTAPGGLLYRDLSSALADLKAAEERVLGLGSRVAGPLRISAPTSFGRLYLGPCFAAFLAAHPLVDLQIDLSDEFTNLLDGNYDLAIRIARHAAPALTAHRLASSPRYLCAAPAYLEAHGAPQEVAALARHRLLAAAGQMPWKLLGPGGEATCSGKSVIQTNSSEMIRELCLAGQGIALRSVWDVWEDLAAGRLRRVLPDYGGAQDATIFAVHTPQPRLSGNTAAVIAHLETWFMTERWPQQG